MAGLQGKNYTVQVADLSVSPVAYNDINCQGDLTFNTGKTLEVSRTKNCKHPFFRESGFQATVPVELETPADSTHTLILDAADNETLIGVKITSTQTGAPVWTGNAYVAYDPLNAPTEGPVTINVAIAWVDDPTRTAAS